MKSKKYYNKMPTNTEYWGGGSAEKKQNKRARTTYFMFQLQKYSNWMGYIPIRVYTFAYRKLFSRILSAPSSHTHLYCFSHCLPLPLPICTFKIAVTAEFIAYLIGRCIIFCPSIFSRYFIVVAAIKIINREQIQCWLLWFSYCCWLVPF